MPAPISSVLRRLTHTIREFTIAQRTMAIIGFAVLALGIAALSFWVTRPQLSPLFSGLSGTDANTLVEQLRADGVQYQITGGGGTIMVPEESVYAERLKAAAAGLPSSSTGGYSLLDKMGVTASEFQQNVTYKRAIEGELANTIKAMKGVKTASVQLAIPKDTVFVSEKTDPTASVFIATNNGVTLNDEQVQAIVHLTSSSIDGMKTSDVSVVDAQGLVLSAAGVDVAGSGSKRASDYEERVRSSVQSMLDKVVGPGNATVVVAADVSQNSGQRTAETFTTPDGSPALSESAQNDGTGRTSGSNGSAGILGPDNIAVPSGTSAANPTAGTSTGATGATSVTKNNAINKVTEQTTIPAGSITRQTVSVAVNKAVSGVNKANLISLVNAAAGIDTTRGDSVAIEIVSFNRAGAADAAKAIAASEAAANADRTAGLIRTALTALAVALPIIIAMFLVFRRFRSRSQEDRELQEMTELAELRAMMSDQTRPIALTGTEPPAALTYTQVPLIEPGDTDRKRAEIDALAGTDPERTAEILRGLMDDRQPA
ncbi:flagellar basal-body MS-ring/collar protein FliF [Glaciihabitans sp. GrIS 2.15]|uniref:flagellar basal-body MS-ring/collar protein FliF n=1 Tax=Glaciihabitans sp. GrIS 2.15 TaxID=3071710 RepID=UPI002E07CFF7|nr:flagellar M-ring protein FliF [Glaciihabitans sp. GrIS 2.15]